MNGTQSDVATAMRAIIIHIGYAHGELLALSFATDNITHEQLTSPAVLKACEGLFVFKVELGSIVPEVIARIEHIAAYLLAIAHDAGTDAQTEQI